MRMGHYLLACLLLVLLWACETARPIGKQNLAYQYQDGFPFEVRHRIMDTGEEWTLFIQLNFRKLQGIQQPSQIWDKYKITYVITPGYESSRILQKDSIGIDHRLAPSVNPLVLMLRLPKGTKNRLFTLQLREKNTAEPYFFDIPLREEEGGGNNAIALFQKNGRIPLFSNYIQTTDTVVIRSFSFGMDQLSFEYHPFTSSVALPPMAAMPTSGHDFDSHYDLQVAANQRVIFKQPGYYFLPSVKEKNQGFGFMVVDSYFPSVTKPMELIDPMIYISTREERRNLLEASNKKLALDNFWLKVNPQKNAARKLIRNYFENIELANYLFSSHKDGWKTDQGMVLAIYGPPPMVHRSWDLEVWQYEKTQNTENTIFYFNRKPYEKDPNVWELKRFSEYDRFWYGVVELWRKGVINR